MAAMSRSALVNDGVPAFMVLLVLLLAISLVAVIRLPRWAGTPSDDDTQDETGHPAPSRAGPRDPVPGRRERRPLLDPVRPSWPVPRASPASRIFRPGTSPARCLG